MLLRSEASPVASPPSTEDTTVEEGSVWGDVFSLVLDYGKENNGNHNIPYNYKKQLPSGELVSVGRWLNHNKKLYWSGLLSTTQMNQFRQLLGSGKMNSCHSPDPSNIIRATSSGGTSTRGRRRQQPFLADEEDIVGISHSNSIMADVASVGKDSLASTQVHGQAQGHSHRHLPKKAMKPGDTIIVIDDDGEDDETWEAKFSELLKYGKRNSCDYNVSESYSTYMPNGEYVRLGKWLKEQKLAYLNHSMRSDRVHKFHQLIRDRKLDWGGSGLGSIAPKRKYESLDNSNKDTIISVDKGTPPINTSKKEHSEQERWDYIYSLLLAYGKKHSGNCNVPYEYTVTDSNGVEVCVGRWLTRQRYARKEGKLPRQRELKLQSLVDAGRLLWSKHTSNFERSEDSYEVEAEVEKRNTDGLIGSGRNQKRDLATVKNSITKEIDSFNHDSSKIISGHSINALRWNEMYALLLQYGRENGGNCDVPVKCKFMGPHGRREKLGLWLQTQKSSYQRGTLGTYRQQRLQRLVDKGSMTWSRSKPPTLPPPHLLSTITSSGALRSNAKVPIVTPENETNSSNNTGILGNDMTHDNKVSSSGESNNIVTRRNDARWDFFNDLLLAYGAEHHGHYNVPYGYVHKHTDGTNVSLGKWLSDQKRCYKKGTMYDYRQRKLQALIDNGSLNWDDIGKSHQTNAQKKKEVVVAQAESGEQNDDSDEIIPDECTGEAVGRGKGRNKADNDNRWNYMYSLLLEYIKNHGDGDCRVPCQHVVQAKDGTSEYLGRWVTKQRYKYKSGFLPSHRKIKLQKLINDGKLDWGGRRSRTIKAINTLDDSLLDNGPLNDIPLDDSLVNKDPLDDSMLSAIIKYGAARDGHCDVPVNYTYTLSDGTSIAVGKWLYECRDRYISNTLASEHKLVFDMLVEKKMLDWRIPESFSPPISSAELQQGALN